MIAMTSVCWWAFTSSREGYMPQMYGSIRVICASTGSLKWFPADGIQWGDRECLTHPRHSQYEANDEPVGMGLRFRRAGFSADPVAAAVPGELYCSNNREAEHRRSSAGTSLRQRYSSETMKSNSKVTSQQFERGRSESLTADYQYYRSTS